MQPATKPIQRRPDARLLVVDGGGWLRHTRRSGLADALRPGDLLVGNDAATIPASLAGLHERTGAAVEARLAARPSLEPGDVREFNAVMFGAGDYRTRTEDRPPPPQMAPGDALRLGPLRATVLRLLGHPRLVLMRFDGTADAIWAGIARAGKPIQYAHVDQPLAMWDVWTRIAALPVAFEPPSAGFVLDWRLLAELRSRGVTFATLTLAAGISSTGDPVLDARLPFDEPYRIPESTARSVAETRTRGGRVIAIGTSTTRALEHAASRGLPLVAGPGVATQRLGRHASLHVVDAIVTGAHPPGESHYELLRAFAPDLVLSRMSAALEAAGYRSHEFGDSVLLERQRGVSPTELRGRNERSPPDQAEPGVGLEGELRPGTDPGEPVPAARSVLIALPGRRRALAPGGGRPRSTNPSPPRARSSGSGDEPFRGSDGSLSGDRIGHPLT